MTGQRNRVSAGVPTGGQFAHDKRAEPPMVSLVGDDCEGVDPSADLAIEDLPDGLLCLYKGDLYHPSGAIEAMIRRGDASPAARTMDIDDVLRQVVESNGFDYADESSWDSDEFPKAVRAKDCYFGEASQTIIGPDGRTHIDLYADADDMPPDLEGLDRNERREAFAQYVETAQWSSLVTTGDDGDGEPEPADDFELTPQAVRALRNEAAALWHAIPPDIRQEIGDSGVDIKDVFHKMQLSATGAGTGLWDSEKLGELGQRAHDALYNTPAQRQAEFGGDIPRQR